MRALITLGASAAVPWLICAAPRIWLTAAGPDSLGVEGRALLRYRRMVLGWGMVLLPASAVAGALAVDPALSIRSPTAGSWFYASLCAATAWASLALAQRMPNEAAAMSGLESLGRAVLMSAVPSLGVGLSLLARSGVVAVVPAASHARTAMIAMVSVLAVLVVTPWLAVRVGLWRSLPTRVDTEGVSWRVAHLPAPAPFVTHAAALPWLRTVLVTDGLFRRVPDTLWRALVRYEVAGARTGRTHRAVRWSISLPLSMVVFAAAQSVGSDDPRKLVAATVLAVVFAASAAWFANREPSSKLALDGEGPSAQELAQTLRNLPPSYGQALPRTSHRPLGAALYNRLFALGHDPGRRPHA